METAAAAEFPPAVRPAPASGARLSRVRDWPFFWKLMAVFAAVFAGAMVGVLVLWSRASTQRDAAERLAQVEFAGVSLVLNADRDAHAAALALSRATLAADAAERARWLAAYADARDGMEAGLRSYAALPALDATARGRAAAAAAAGVTLAQAGDSAAGRLRAGTATAAAAHLSVLQARLDALHEVLRGAEKAHAADAARLGVSVRTAAATFALLTWGGLAFFLLVGVFVAWLMTREVAAPLERLAGVSERIARGELALEPVALQRGDEVGRLSASFDRMVPYLRDLLLRVQVLSGEVAQSSGNIAATARDTSESMAHLSVAIEQITQGAQEQAQAAQETAEVVLDMSGAIQRVAGGAAAIAGDAGQTVSVARRGGETVQQAIGSMEDVRTAVVDAAAQVRALGERTQRIGQIVEVISQIAGRTNLLALNAAIEAARAGDHGRGFAVVADEVRKLADGSRKSAAEIAELIASIEQGTRQAVEAMEAGVGRVEREAAATGEAMTALAEILAAVEATGQRVGSISEDAAVLAQHADRVSALVQDVASVAEESAASAEEMAAQSLQVASAMEAISPATDDEADASATAALRRVALELQDVATSFKV